jgi:hypothetical protein
MAATTKIDTSKLPKWAQEAFRDLERQRDAAVRALNEFTDSETPSPVYYEDAVCTGEQTGPSFKRHNVQTHCVVFEHTGVKMRVLLRDDHIDVSWETNDRRNGEVAMIPKSYQQVKLVAREKMYP